MNSIIEKNLRGITAASIEKYLTFTGWERDLLFANHRIRVFINKSEPDFRIAVPANENSKDFYSKVYDVIVTLSDYYDKSFEDMVVSLKSAYTDRIQFRIITEATKDGKVPLSYAAQCIEGLRDLVLYAACAEENAKPICSRTYNGAKNSLEKFQFGQTEYGSFVFNIDVQVASEENEQAFLADVPPQIEEPKEHKVVKRIKTAIQQVDSVVNRTVRVGDIIDTAYEEGITANMCDALMKLKPDGVEDVSIETSFRFAEAITLTAEQPERRMLENLHFACFDEISKRYKDRTLVEDVVLRGTIKMLSKDNNPNNNEMENTVRLLAKVDERMRSITLHLSARDHAAACDAYRDDKEVEVAGTLDKSMSRWFFSTVTDFSVVD